MGGVVVLASLLHLLSNSSASKQLVSLISCLIISKYRFKRRFHNHQTQIRNSSTHHKYRKTCLILVISNSTAKHRAIYPETTCSISSRQIWDHCEHDLICKDRYVPGEMPDQSYSFRGSIMQLFILSVLTNNVFLRVSSTPHV